MFSFSDVTASPASNPFLYNTAYCADISSNCFGNLIVTFGFLYKSLLSSFASSTASTVIVCLSDNVEILFVSNFISAFDYKILLNLI